MALCRPSYITASKSAVTRRRPRLMFSLLILPLWVLRNEYFISCIYLPVSCLKAQSGTSLPPLWLIQIVSRPKFLLEYFSLAIPTGVFRSCKAPRAVQIVQYNHKRLPTNTYALCCIIPVFITNILFILLNKLASNAWRILLYSETNWSIDE